MTCPYCRLTPGWSDPGECCEAAQLATDLDNARRALHAATFLLDVLGHTGPAAAYRKSGGLTSPA